MDSTSAVKPYRTKHRLRILTSGSLFDGHDVAINIMRRILQRSGAEVIHLGHNRPVHEIVAAAVQEDVQAIAITSYQGGHLEFFKYTYDLLREHDAGHIKIFGGGGGTILPHEIDDLHDYGINRIFSPDDGRALGLQGMINEVLRQADFPRGQLVIDPVADFSKADFRYLADCISAAENYPVDQPALMQLVKGTLPDVPVIGVTGTGGSGKSSLVDELVLRMLAGNPNHRIAIVSVDPSKRKTGGALLGDRIRMNAIFDERVFMRSMATRQSNQALTKSIQPTLAILKKAQFDIIILETSGIGQSGSEVVDYANHSLYVMTPEYGAATQLEKIDMLDYADLVAINKSDKKGAEDALRDVRKQYQRNHLAWETPPEHLPVYPTVASQFNDPGIDALFEGLKALLAGESIPPPEAIRSGPGSLIPSARVRYLSEVAETVRTYNIEASNQAEIASQLDALRRARKLLLEESKPSAEIDSLIIQVEEQLNPESQLLLESWNSLKARYQESSSTYQVRGREITVDNYTASLSHQRIPKIAMPKYRDAGDVLEWCLQENVPGAFPYTAGVFPVQATR